MTRLWTRPAPLRSVQRRSVPLRSVSLLFAAALLASACSTAGDQQVLGRTALTPAGRAAEPPGTTTSSAVAGEAPPLPSTSAAPEFTAAPAPPPTDTTATPAGAAPTAAPAPPPPTAPPPTAPPPTAPPRPRVVVEQAWTPFAAVGGVTLVHPSPRVERVGFHQSNHDGARQLEPLPTAVAPATMEARDRRLTGSRTAADVVIDPDVEVRAPVTGTVKRAGTYVLYCDYSDDYAVIEPDARPGWEVKILHIDGVQVGAGDRVVAGETVIAGGPTPLPFESQVDELTSAATAWPHVHIEVIDLAIPDIPSPGGGC
jgi:murein DD-endopeptidase MepM/ murein hydrolase activator NlpD